MGFETERGSGDLSWGGGKISLAHLLSNCNRVKSRYGRKILFQLHKHRLGKESLLPLHLQNTREGHCLTEEKPAVLLTERCHIPCASWFARTKFL